jgi:aspartyl aminopeptidase
LDFELQLADVQPSAVIGACNEFVSSGRLDNQGSCYCATKALVASLDPATHGGQDPLAACKSINVISMFDHEEVNGNGGGDLCRCLGVRKRGEWVARA